ncbi:cation-transporting P-type ATPase [Candidatus Venteria ishoeyi]|uniref:Putative cation-transporting ATPase F n=1 Tax=Candidatus Venteria ishoeyi TaxID=1899563 RepID=A0A1H6F8L7_9GAMM|nr:cation-transporting P-type ATPase [Candidatus Venteria ishoeyi]SEH05741.1 putative cation-transporting ATPase F [Candidatus Venteria ishoeyi]
MNKKWYQLNIEESFAALSCQESGLSSKEAQKRLQHYGYNELSFKRRSAWMRFLSQFHNPLVYILLLAATTTAILSFSGNKDMFADTLVILCVVILNAILGFFPGKAKPKAHYLPCKT